jgi:glycosyltransferase involved in cell wall biosynthesis
MARILIVQSQVKRYRVPFFTGLHAAIQEDGNELVVAYSAPNRIHAARQDEADLPRSFGLKVKGRWIFDRFVYQHVWKEIWRADLVIVGPEIKFVINPALLTFSALRLKRVAYWGLGPNMHPDKCELSERIKDRLVARFDWWFAYTPSVKEYIQRHGVPADRITNVQNATDTLKLRALMSTIGKEEAATVKEQLTGIRDSKIGIYCGLIAGIKAIPLLLAAARRVKQRCPEFHLVLVGEGPDRQWLEEAVRNESWIHYLGSKYGRESAMLYKIADVFLLAGTAGLAIVDSFAASLPLIATDLNTHPPEVTYLRNGENSIVSAHNPAAYGDAITSVLTNPDRMERLRQGAIADGSRYTMEAMVQNFREGIRQCLRHYRIPRESYRALKPFSNSTVSRVNLEDR